MTGPDELRHQLLQMTDRALGAEARLARVEELARHHEAARAAAEEQAASLRSQRDRARKELAAVRASTSWRLGSGVVRVFGRVRRVARRLVGRR